MVPPSTCDCADLVVEIDMRLAIFQKPCLLYFIHSRSRGQVTSILQPRRPPRSFHLSSIAASDSPEFYWHIEHIVFWNISTLEFSPTCLSSSFRREFHQVPALYALDRLPPRCKLAASLQWPGVVTARPTMVSSIVLPTTVSSKQIV